MNGRFILPLSSVAVNTTLGPTDINIINIQSLHCTFPERKIHIIMIFQADEL